MVKKIKRTRITAVERDFAAGFSVVTDGKRWGCINDDDGAVEWAPDEATARDRYAEHVRASEGRP